MIDDATWNRCDYCGQFIAMIEFEKGRAKRTMLTPDSEFTAETYETICAKCAGRIAVVEEQ